MTGQASRMWIQCDFSFQQTLSTNFLPTLLYYNVLYLEAELSEEED